MEDGYSRSAVVMNASAFIILASAVLSAASHKAQAPARTMAIEGSLPNPGNILRPGQYEKATDAVETRKGILLVPQRAVNELQVTHHVGVVGGDSKAQMRVGPRSGLILASAGYFTRGWRKMKPSC